jgi:hypothetical protein
MTMTARTQSTVLFAAASILFILVFIFLLAVVPAHGQFATYPAMEPFIGFSANNNEYGSDRHNSFGVQFSAGYNPHPFVRLVADFAGQYHGSDIRWDVNNHTASLKEYQFLIGPEFPVRNDTKTTPFFRAMVGVAGRNYAVPTDDWEYNWATSAWTPQDFSLASDLGFAASFGAGVDVDINPMLAFRVVQFDYLRTHLSRDKVNWEPVQGQLPVVTGWQNNYRFACGIVLKLGERGGRRR